MIYVDDKMNVSIHGMDNKVLPQLGIAAGELAEELGRDRVLEAVVIALYAKDRAAMDRIHEKLKKGGMNV